MYTIDTLKEFAKNKGGECLSDKYKTNNTNYVWVCTKGHQFEKQWMVVKTRGVWCDLCRLGHYIEYLQDYANKFGGKCLSDKFTDSKRSTKYLFKCDLDHKFQLTYVQIKKDVWCKFCKNNQKNYELKHLQEYAIKNHGVCLSTIYLSVMSKYSWKCQKGHEWEANWHNMVYGNTWCQECRLWTLEKLDTIAKTNKGTCIRLLEGSGLEGLYEWTCKKEHIWHATGGNVVHNKTWCPHCQKLSLDDCYDEAKKHNGKCLETIYVNRRTHMLWECKKGHQFKLTMGSVRNSNRWCKKCFVDNQRHDISVSQDIAKKYGGECLSTEYINLETSMKWRCKEGHEWTVNISNIKGSGSWCRMCHMRSRRDKSITRLFNWVNILGGKVLNKKDEIPYDIRSDRINVNILCNKNHTFTRTLESLMNGSWCPKCIYKSESACRDILEKIYTYTFPKRRLQCMEYLEFDGYCEELGLAFEYDGKQHVEYIPHFHRNGEKDLEKQIERDNRKNELCDMNSFILIRIPHIYSYNEPDKLENFIMNELEKFGM